MKRKRSRKCCWRNKLKRWFLLTFILSSSLYAQYFDANEYLQYKSGLQIQENGAVLLNKKKWKTRKKKKTNSVIYSNKKEINHNIWGEESAVIKKKKNKIEIIYDDLKSENKQIQSVFQGVKTNKNEKASIINYSDGELQNITTCTGIRCHTITPKFCQQLIKQIGGEDNKAMAIKNAKECQSFSKAFSGFKENDKLIIELGKLHIENLQIIDTKISEYVGTDTKFSNKNNQLEILTQIKQGRKNQYYYQTLIDILELCP